MCLSEATQIYCQQTIPFSFSLKGIPGSIFIKDMKQRSPNPVAIIAKNCGVYFMRSKAKFQVIPKQDYPWLLLLGFLVQVHSSVQHGKSDRRWVISPSGLESSSLSLPELFERTFPKHNRVGEVKTETRSEICFTFC